MNCPNSNNTGNELSTVHLTKVQSIYTFDCHCFTIHADEIRIVPDPRHCEDIDIFNISTIHYPINIAYLSEYFTADQLSSLEADTLLNDTLEADLPDLTMVDKLLDEKFSIEEKAAFDMEMVINSTKTSADVYDNLAHYLFNEMIKAQGSAGDFDFFSPWTWFTIFGWIISCAALVLVIMLHLKVRPLFFILMARGSHAASLGLMLHKITAVTPVTQPSMDAMAEWIKHVSHVPSLLPAEILILLGIIFAIVFKVICMIYRARKKGHS